MFEQAARLKLRFPYKGSITAEDLFDLTPTQLDGIFKTLNSQRKDSEQESLLTVRNKDTEILDLQIAIVRHVVGIKMQEAAARQEKREKAERRQQLLQILASKEEQALQNKSVEELRAELAGLE